VPPDLDPDRRSFVRTLRVVSPSGDRTDGPSPDQVAAAAQTGVEELLTEPLPTPAACVPRTVRRKMSNYQLRRGSASQLVAADHAARRGGSVLSPALPGTSCRGRANERANARWQGWDGRALGMPMSPWPRWAADGRRPAVNIGHSRYIDLQMSGGLVGLARTAGGTERSLARKKSGSDPPGLCRRYTPGRYAPASSSPRHGPPARPARRGQLPAASQRR
jgi:hypothetical protein